MAREQHVQVLKNSTIIAWSVTVLVIAAGMTSILLWQFGGGTEQDTNRLDAVRTAASIIVDTGGAAALLLAARRQRATELGLAQQHLAADRAEHDATERRITELYAKAADQLGSPKAPVRLAGLYALERLAQDNPRHRQTVVNVICAYLPCHMVSQKPPQGPRARCGKYRRSSIGG